MGDEPAGLIVTGVEPDLPMKRRANSAKRRARSAREGFLHRWGSPADILNPAAATGEFLDHLVTIPLALPAPGVAEQLVQRSVRPQRYAPQEPQTQHGSGHVIGRDASSRSSSTRVPAPSVARTLFFVKCPDPSLTSTDTVFDAPSVTARSRGP